MLSKFLDIRDMYLHTIQRVSGRIPELPPRVARLQDLEIIKGK